MPEKSRKMKLMTGELFVLLSLKVLSSPVKTVCGSTAREQHASTISDKGYIQFKI